MPAFLHPMQPMPHCIQVHHDFLRVLGQRAHAHVQQAGFDLARIMRELVAARAIVVGEFQTVSVELKNVRALRARRPAQIRRAPTPTDTRRSLSYRWSMALCFWLATV